SAESNNQSHTVQQLQQLQQRLHGHVVMCVSVFTACGNKQKLTDPTFVIVQHDKMLDSVHGGLADAQIGE
ncbi:hypothetical protein JOB18_047146, partial [Solea senegalensis]